MGLGILTENRDAGMKIGIFILNGSSQAAAGGEKGIWVTILEGQTGAREENSREGLFLTDSWEFFPFLARALSEHLNQPE